MNIKGLAAIIIITAASYVQAASPESRAKAPDVKDKKVTVELYVMSFCPFGVQVENALLPVVSTYSENIEFSLGYIGKKSEGTDGKIHLTSLHGQAEINENLRQICARDLFPGKWLDYVLERDKGVREDWRPAAEKVDIDTTAIDACAADAGIKSYALNLALAKAKNAVSSPTIYIDGELYGGPRTRESFEWSVCSEMKTRGITLPVACEKVLAGPQPTAPADAVIGGCGGF